MGKFLLILAAMGGGFWYTQYYPAWKIDREVKRVVEQDNQQLPKIFNNSMRVEKIRYENHIVHITGTILDNVPITDEQKPVFEALLKDMYCRGVWKSYSENKVTIETTIKFEAVNYRGIEWVYTDNAQTCG